MKKKVLVLGGGLLQIPLMEKARQKGFAVFLSDYYENPPGKKYCDHSRQISTVNIEDNYKFVSEEKIDYIMTIGTDQPVYTAAFVSEKLKLPFPISEQQGKAVTNKYYMKTKMTEHKIPTPDFRVQSTFDMGNLRGLNYPLVIKPVDSQGQRGIFVIKDAEQLSRAGDLFEVSKKYSPSGTVIFEEFYRGDEITVNCWVKNGQTYILMITDRLHFDDEMVLGICKQQRYPSKYAMGRLEEINITVQKLAGAFGITDGPLYIQMIVGDRGVQIVEFGYRIGGGFESEIIPRVTGIDILDLYFTLITEGKNTFEPEYIGQRVKVGSIFFLLAKPGVAEKIVMPDEFALYGKLFIKEGAQIEKIIDATSRVGCFAFYTDSEAEYEAVLKKLNAQMVVYDEQKTDLLIHDIWE